MRLGWLVAAFSMPAWAGISCHLPTNEECERLVRKHMAASYLLQVERVQEDIRAGVFGYRKAPNCHWAGLAWANRDVLTKPEPVNFPVLENALSATYQEVSSDKARSGDLVVYFAHVKKRVIKDTPDGGIEKVWHPFVYAYHTAILLEGDRIFQKENNGDDVFSVTTLEKARDTYENYLNSKSHLEYGELRRKYYRDVESR